MAWAASHSVSPTTLVHEHTMKNGNATLFRDPNTGLLHLFWYRTTQTGSGPYEIRVKSSGSPARGRQHPAQLLLPVEHPRRQLILDTRPHHSGSHQPHKAHD